jgi:hypothetical protein
MMNNETMNTTAIFCAAQSRVQPAARSRNAYRAGNPLAASAFTRTLAAASALPIVLSLALAFAALPATHACAQANSANAANAASASEVPALLGGKVEALVANAAGDTLATAIEGAGLYVGTISAGGMNWTAQTFPSSANPGPYVTHLAWDAAGELWASAGGLGLWKRSAAGAWSQVRGVGG